MYGEVNQCKSPVVKMPKLDNVPVIEAFAVRVVVASKPRMMGPAATAHAQLNKLSFFTFLTAPEKGAS